MTRVYDREKIEIHCETKNVLIHIGVMISISIFFIIFFKLVSQNPNLQELIKQNVAIVPIGQILAYEGYVGYVFLKFVRKWQENIKLRRTWMNAAKIGLKLFHEYVTWVLDLIAITVITFEFFIFFLPPDQLEKALETSRIADYLLVSILPGLVIITHLVIREIRLEKR